MVVLWKCAITEVVNGEIPQQTDSGGGECEIEMVFNLVRILSGGGEWAIGICVCICIVCDGDGDGDGDDRKRGSVFVYVAVCVMVWW